MFATEMLHAIDSFGAQKFVNDKIEVEFSPNTCSHIHELFEAYQHEYKPPFRWEKVGDVSTAHCFWEKIYDSTLKNQWGYPLTKGVRLIKTNFTSNDDNQVNPEFLATLKKMLMAYLTALGSDWDESEIFARLELNSGDRVIANRCKPYRPIPHITLGSIVSKYPNIKVKIKIHRFDDANYVTGKWEDLERFRIILKKESFEDTRKLLFLAGTRKNPESPLSSLPPDIRKYIFALIKAK